jgi:hypothetical protein
MNSIYDELAELVRSQERTKAVERLTEVLRQRKDYHSLFYALVLAKRIELGLPAVHIGSLDIPPEVEEPYEQAIRDAARTVGRLLLSEKSLSAAWPYFRMIGETEPMRAAIEQVEASDEEASQQAIEIGFHEGVHPRRGFELLLDRYGICSAITAVGQAFHLSAEIRNHCIRLLVRALHRELRERLRADLQARGQEPPPDSSVPELIRLLDWSPEEEFYHVDISHLGTVTQYSLQLPVCEELELALELCAYGERLPARFRYRTDPPFENQYRDYAIYLKVLLGRETEAGIAHFRAKAEAADPQEVGTYPAQVLVTLLDRIGQTREAIAVFQRYLAHADPQQLSCPSLAELCQRVGDYAALVEVSRQREDLLNYTAGLLQASVNSRQDREGRCGTGQSDKGVVSLTPNT